MKKLALVLLALANGIAVSQTFQPNDWMTDGIVSAIVAHPNQNKIFIGGSFNYVGPVIAQQNGAALSATTGAVNTAFPVVTGGLGNVAVAIPDGAGGWYIGGNFTQVGSSPRNSLARINASGTVLPFNPNPTSGVNAGTVYALALSGDTLFVGGSFDAIGGQPRSYLAAVSITTGTAFSWDASVDGDVYTIVVSPTSVFIAGFFTNVGGSAISDVAKIVRATALPDVAFPTVTGGGVNALALSGDTLFVGGAFTMVGASARQKLASINHVTNTLTAWNPSPNGDVNAMLTHGNSLYVGGVFFSIAGGTRNFCAEFTLNDATLTNWSTNGYNCFSGTGTTALTFANGAVYVGGGMTATVPGIRGLAAFDSITGILTNWYPGAAVLSGGLPTIRTLSASGTQVYVGGEFFSIGGKAREHLAAIDVASGTATDWNAGSVFGDITRLAISGNTLFVGGGFTGIGCLTSRQGLAALDATTGAVMSWQADIQNGTSIDAMKVSGSTLYVGGSFSTVGGQSRNLLAAINTSTAAVQSWNPNPTNTGFAGINAIETIGNRVYVGGFFNSIGGASRMNFAELDSTTGLATSFDAGAILPSLANVSVYALKASESGSTLYVGGNFTQISGQSRRGACAYNFSALSLTLTSWNPSVNGVVRTLLPAPTGVYVGGNLDSVGTERRRGLASVSTTGIGAVSSFNPDMSSQVLAIESYGTSLFAGGYADSVSSQFHRGLARFIDPALPVQLGSFTATLNQHRHVVLNWVTISEINNYGFFVQKKRESETQWVEIPNIFIPGHGTTNEPHQYTYTDATPASGRWHYRLKQVDLDGTINFTEPVAIDILTSVAGKGTPTEFAMEQNYPNPFNPSTTIHFSVGTYGYTSLRVFNLLGQEVATLVNENLQPGSYQTTFSGEGLASGVYFYRLTSGGQSLTKKLLLTK